jgi:hypothetical protein
MAARRQASKRSVDLAALNAISIPQEEAISATKKHKSSNASTPVSIVEEKRSLRYTDDDEKKVQQVPAAIPSIALEGKWLYVTSVDDIIASMANGDGSRVTEMDITSYFTGPFLTLKKFAPNLIRLNIYSPSALASLLFLKPTELPPIRKLSIRCGTVKQAIGLVSMLPGLTHLDIRGTSETSKESRIRLCKMISEMKLTSLSIASNVHQGEPLFESNLADSLEDLTLLNAADVAADGGKPWTYALHDCKRLKQLYVVSDVPLTDIQSTLLLTLPKIERLMFGNSYTKDQLFALVDASSSLREILFEKFKLTAQEVFDVAEVSGRSTIKKIDNPVRHTSWVTSPTAPMYELSGPGRSPLMLSTFV